MNLCKIHNATIEIRRISYSHLNISSDGLMNNKYLSFNTAKANSIMHIDFNIQYSIKRIVNCYDIFCILILTYSTYRHT